MASVPTIEAVLLEVVQSLDLSAFETKTKNNFALRRMSLDNHFKKLKEVVLDICRELKLEPPDRVAFGQQIDAALYFNCFLERSIWTTGADQRQVLWYLLGYSYVPFMGRTVAFWQLGGVMDKGMPGGSFWYLPQVRKNGDSEELILPVVAVMEWLLDLTGMSRREMAIHLTPGYDEKTGTSDDKTEHIISDFNKWKAGTLPRAKTIDDIFSDKRKLEFKGCFEINDKLDSPAKIKEALKFIARKGLTADSLRHEIPMTLPGCIEAVLEGNASEDVQNIFLELLSTRYSAPSMEVIRRMFLIARAIQDGYDRLVKVLCPGMQLSTDPEKNKVLQLICIYQHIYNLTIEAHMEGGDTWVQQDTWFENQAMLRFPLFWENLISIFPSWRGDGTDAPRYLGQKLSRRFAQLQGGEPLEDFIPSNHENAAKIYESNRKRIEKEIRLEKESKILGEQIQYGAPRSELQKVTSIEVLEMLYARHANISENTRMYLLARIKELAETPVQKLYTNLAELSHYLNGERKKRPKDCADIVANILHEADNNPAAEWFKAPLLQFKAKHALAQNNFDDAEKLFREALEDCHTRSYGTLRGEIARDLWSIAVSGSRLIPENHEIYYRNAVFYGIIPPTMKFEDAAVEIADYFWQDLYKPYHGFPKTEQYDRKIVESITSEFIENIVNYSDELVGKWCQKNSSLKNKRLSDVRGDTVLNLWIKISGEFTKRISFVKSSLPDSHKNDVEVIEELLNNWHRAIGVIVQKWPKLLDMPDFKKQTPLMLASENGDTYLVEMFLKAGADTSLQSFEGQSALHAAIRNGSIECVRLLLDYGINTNLATYDGQNVLHTAVKFGNPDIVKMILRHNPDLLNKKNCYDMSPVDLLNKIMSSNLDEYIDFMKEYSGRKVGVEAAYREIKDTLMNQVH